MAMRGPGERVACTIRRTATYGLHIHVAPQLDSTSLAETIDAVATRLVLVPRFVVLETGHSGLPMIMRCQWEPSRRSCVGQESSYASWLLQSRRPSCSCAPGCCLPRVAFTRSSRPWTAAAEGRDPDRDPRGSRVMRLTEPAQSG
jgi:hypothetical protein